MGQHLGLVDAAGQIVVDRRLHVAFEHLQHHDGVAAAGQGLQQVELDRRAPAVVQLADEGRVRRAAARSRAASGVETRPRLRRHAPASAEARAWGEKRQQHRASDRIGEPFER